MYSNAGVLYLTYRKGNSGGARVCVARTEQDARSKRYRNLYCEMYFWFEATPRDVLSGNTSPSLEVTEGIELCFDTIFLTPES